MNEGMKEYHFHWSCDISYSHLPAEVDTICTNHCITEQQKSV